jgi:hypothetical protein
MRCTATNGAGVISKQSEFDRWRAKYSHYSMAVMWAKGREYL